MKSHAYVENTNMNQTPTRHENFQAENEQQESKSAPTLQNPIDIKLADKYILKATKLGKHCKFSK